MKIYGNVSGWSKRYFADIHAYIFVLPWKFFYSWFFLKDGHWSDPLTSRHVQVDSHVIFITFKSVFIRIIFFKKKQSPVLRTSFPPDFHHSFLVVTKRLYKKATPSVGPSVRPSVGPSNRSLSCLARKM